MSLIHIKLDIQVSVSFMAQDHFGPMELEDTVWLLSEEYMLDTWVSGRFRWIQHASQRQLFSQNGDHNLIDKDAVSGRLT